MIDPHYILLHPDNFDEIVKWTHGHYKDLEENYEESLDMSMDWYVRFYRVPEADYIPTYKTYTQVEMMVEFNMSRIDPRSKHRFVKF